MQDFPRMNPRLSFRAHRERSQYLPGERFIAGSYAHRHPSPIWENAVFGFER